MRSVSLYIGLALFWLANSAAADSLKTTDYHDQWDKPLNISNTTEWVLFSHHKAGNEWVKNAIEALKLEPLRQHNLTYVADISKMPGLVTTLFALPKMRDYSFRIAIADEPEHTQDWPRQEDQLSLIGLNKLEVVSVRYLASQDDLFAALKELQRPANVN